MKTHARPAFAPGISPIFARLRNSSGCIKRKSAASPRESVFMQSHP
jgi:hypothetical protein